MKYRLKYLTILLIATLGCWFTTVARDLPVTTIGDKACYVYDVKKGENIYAVARDLKISTRDIIKLNPSAADGLRPGMRLYFPKEILDGENTTDNTTSTISGTAAVVTKPVERVTTVTPVNEQAVDKVNDAGKELLPATYTVKKGESLYGISRRFGLTVEQLVAMNPSAEYGVSNGQVLTINPAATVENEEDSQLKTPIDYSLDKSERRVSATKLVPVNDPVEENEPILPAYEDNEITLTQDVDTVSMAVILPFMLHEGQQNKVAQLFAEFYKGLMLAVDSLDIVPASHHVQIYVYDSASSVDTITSIMRRPELRDVSLIIGPDNESHLQLIAESMSPTTTLYNTFNVRSELWHQNRHVVQANIPHAPMLEKAVNEFVTIYNRYTPVFIARIDGAADKDTFTSLLKQTLDKDGREYKEVTFRNLLSHSDLESLEMDSSYVFVPVSGSRAEFAKFSEAVRKFGEMRTSSSTRVWGYPDWITFRGEYFTRLCELEATIYTRFYYDDKESESQDFDALYKRTYGTGLMDAAPVQGVLGFDTGMYLLGLLKDYGKDFAMHLTPYIGLQNVLNFSTADNHGAVNDALMIVTFSPDGKTLKSTIE